MGGAWPSFSTPASTHFSVPTPGVPTSPLRTLITTNADPGADATCTPTSITAAVVYLHEFPAIAVHPCRGAFASPTGFASKLCEGVLSLVDHCAVVALNTPGISESDMGLPFKDKTLLREV